MFLFSIQKEHCEIKNEDSKKITIKTFGEAKVLVNGEPVDDDEEEELHHLDRFYFLDRFIVLTVLARDVKPLPVFFSSLSISLVLVRVMFGTSHLYVFHHPAEVQSSSLKQADITYEMAQEEIAKNAGLDVDDQESKGDLDVAFQGGGAWACIITEALRRKVQDKTNQIQNGLQ